MTIVAGRYRVEPVFGAGVLLWIGDRTSVDSGKSPALWIDVRAAPAQLFRFTDGGLIDALASLDAAFGIDGSGVIARSPGLTETAAISVSGGAGQWQFYDPKKESSSLEDDVGDVEGCPTSDLSCLAEFAYYENLKQILDSSASALICVRITPWGLWATGPVVASSTPTIGGVYCNYERTSTRSATQQCWITACGCALITWTEPVADTFAQTITVGPQVPPCAALPPPGVPWTPPELPP